MKNNSNITSRKILTYDDLKAVEAGSSTEPLVDVRSFDDSLLAEYAKKDMLPYTGDVIYVRKTLAEKLAAINKALSTSTLKLKIVYGYRHPEVQRKYFATRQELLRAANPALSQEELDRLTHNFVAVPSVGGHPAGAAIDATLIDFDGNELDMGTVIADYSDPAKVITFADGLTEAQLNNRKILHDAMVQENLAPFYGEWWHFSYGDREWAAFYHQKALYDAIDFKG